MRGTPGERFWAKVDKTGDCWVWTGATARNGYGVFRIDGRNVGAHRFSFHLATGITPGELDVLHACDNPPCVQPDHLFLGTQRDNMADMHAKGRGFIPPPNPRCGEANNYAKLTWVQVLEIRSLYALGGLTYNRIGARYGIAGEHVGLIVRCRIWKEETRLKEISA